MSGGSYDYFYHKIDDFAENMSLRDDPRRLAFKKLMLKIGRACHDIEWEDSGDSDKNHSDKAIDDVFSMLNADPMIIAKAHSYDEFRKLVENYLNKI